MPSRRTQNDEEAQHVVDNIIPGRYQLCICGNHLYSEKPTQYWKRGNGQRSIDFAGSNRGRRKIRRCVFPNDPDARCPCGRLRPQPGCLLEGLRRCDILLEPMFGQLPEMHEQLVRFRSGLGSFWVEASANENHENFSVENEIRNSAAGNDACVQHGYRCGLMFGLAVAEGRLVLASMRSR